ncbi:MAG: SDR family NAD(P)-dependent oxidoreductase, partial [Chloroflexi bacterium]|nr:SDR family NAD(P)-dependent oxidoreductase [Chloroflexota bacterium]
MTEEFDRGAALDKFDIADRVAIVTGGAGLLGRSHALTLASAGAAVVIADVREQAAEETAADVRGATGRECLPLEVDVSDAGSVETMVKQVLERYGRIDILVNNAALDPKFDREHAGRHSTSFEEFPLEAWQQAMDVNITGMFLCAQA